MHYALNIEYKYTILAIKNPLKGIRKPNVLLVGYPVVK